MVKKATELILKEEQKIINQLNREEKRLTKKEKRLIKKSERDAYNNSNKDSKQYRVKENGVTQLRELFPQGDQQLIEEIYKEYESDFD